MLAVFTEGGDRAILLFDAHIERTAYRTAQILNVERSGGYGGFINDAPALADGHLGVGTGNTVNFGA